MKLVYTPDSKSGSARSVGSTPTQGTTPLLFPLCHHCHTRCFCATLVCHCATNDMARYGTNWRSSLDGQYLPLQINNLRDAQCGTVSILRLKIPVFFCQIPFHLSIIPKVCYISQDHFSNEEVKSFTTHSPKGNLPMLKTIQIWILTCHKNVARSEINLKPSPKENLKIQLKETPKV